jgi:hypothetical protein
MSAEEAPITARVKERPSLRLEQIRQLKVTHLLYRFAAGALTSIASGAVTLAAGPRAGGIFLAFPAILAASLTLIADEEDLAVAREDARGAVFGAVAMATFAAIAFVTLSGLPGALALALATAGWLAVALGGYAALWLGRPSER